MKKFRKSARDSVPDPTTEVTDETFVSEALRRSNDTPVLVYVYAPWSAECRTVDSILKNAMSSRPSGQLHSVRLNADKSRKVMHALGDPPAPSMFALSHGEVTGRLEGGFESERIVSFIEAAVSAHMSNEDEDQGVPTEDLITKAAHLLHMVDDPVAGLAMIVVQLLRSGRVEADALAKIGVSPDEVKGIVEASIKVATLSEFSYELEVKAAIREYTREAEIIGIEIGLIPGTDKMELLRQELAAFAVETGITDLRIAYRLLRAEHPDRLPGPAGD